MAPKYFIETSGCQMNVHDSERMAGLLEQAGYELATTHSDAHVLVINTCSVREHAERKLYTRLGELRVLEAETGRKPVVVVAGCVAQQEGSALLRRTNGHVIDVVVGTGQLRALTALLDRATASAFAEVEVGAPDGTITTFPVGVTRRSDAVRASVTIIEGCNDHCAFCVVPATRGHERMRSKAEVLADVSEAVQSGRKEVLLLGQIVNHYRAPDDTACDFAQLLRHVAELPGIERVRFASPHPRHTGAGLIGAVRDIPQVCKHIHLPLQSGSSRILSLMRRRHTREDYLDLIDRVRSAVPEIAISTDLIVGFPGETPEDFDATMTLAASVKFSSIYSFKYSQRLGTLAAKRMSDDISDAEKTDRITALQSLQRAIQVERHEAFVGRVVDVLIDSTSRRESTDVSGRTSGNTVVNISVPADTYGRRSGNWLGRTVPVRITRGGPNSLSGLVESVFRSAERSSC